MSQEPLFWYRPRSDGGCEGPLHNGQIEDVRKASGAWVPLFAGAAPVSADPVDWRAVEGRISEFVGEYEMLGEDGQGRDGCYTPNEHERALILDAMHGLLADDELITLLRSVAAQPDVTQQTLDDVMAGIPARDAEIAALRKEIDTLRAQQDTDKVDAALAEMVHAMFRSGNSVPVTRIMIDRKQYESAIDAARKEQA